MDLITQGLSGALVAQVNAERSERRLASGIGFFAGLLADADVLIRSADDPLINLEFHRQFSHSLFFIPFGGLIAALLLWWFLRNRLTFTRLYLYSTLGYATSGVLDACTSFGTQLLWPFVDTRIAWNIIAVIDPVFTLGILIALIAGWKTRRRIASTVGIAFALLYLSLGWVQHERAESLSTALAEARGHQPQLLVVKPTLANILLWRSVYFALGEYHVDAVRPSLFKGDLIYSGNSIPAFSPEHLHSRLAENSRQFRDLKRFQKLSNGYLVIHPDEPDVIGDIRYAMLPDSIRPLWGIRINTTSPGKHVEEVIRRKTDKATRDRFLAMLMGNPDG